MDNLMKRLESGKRVPNKKENWDVIDAKKSVKKTRTKRELELELEKHIKMCEEKDKEIRKLKIALQWSRAAASTKKLTIRRPKMKAPPPPKPSFAPPQPPTTPRGEIIWTKNSLGKWIPKMPSTPMTRPPSQMPYDPKPCSHNKKKHHKIVRY
tara:strand:- start:223 stop:681 length:459 start_codon:yes stop_codon:yes gene_type:complete